MRSGDYLEIRSLLNKRIGAALARERKKFVLGQLSQPELEAKFEFARELKKVVKSNK